MVGRALRPALVGAAPGCVDARRGERAGNGFVLAFRRGDWSRSDDTPEPIRRASPVASFFGWCTIALLIAALLLPFSLPALVDLVRYIRR